MKPLLPQAPIAALAMAATCYLPATAPAAAAPEPAERDQRGLRPMLVGNIERPLRYTPDGGDFVIVNGAEFFNRPLYGGSSPFRVDAGDRPEFSVYLPGRGGNLRLALAGPGGTKWLQAAAQIEARYRAGTMRYEIRDPLLGAGVLRVTALAPRAGEGLLLQIDPAALAAPVELLIAYGGINGERGGRDGDIGTERQPVREFFQLQPAYCQDNEIATGADSFVVRAKAGTIAAWLPPGATTQLADAAAWNDLPRLLAPPAGVPALPLTLSRVTLAPGPSVYLALQRLPNPRPVATETLGVYREVAAEKAAPAAGGTNSAAWTHAELPVLFAREEAQLRAIAERVKVDTPDSFVNAALPALNIAADAVWDDRVSAFVHGGVAWRVRLLGWRVGYVGDTLGWHERTRAHFSGYAAQQNTTPLPASLPAPEASANLARNETALHSNGDLTKSHYDMNLVGVDAFFRHLLWTGDLDYARQQWPVIERHLAWERRLFRREFGAEKLPLYEAYCCIWASDDLSYHGGGATHSSAYNLYHLRMAARVAKLLGLDATAYEREAELLARGLQQHLWLPDRGWYAEWKDLLGLQLAHPEAAAWTFYHTIDSEVPTPQQAWQMSRFVDTRLPRIPLRGPGVPAGNHTVATTSWLPYTWSLNNVVLGEAVHTALGLWQAGRAAAAYPLLKGVLLDSMYLGLCPGNVGMCTWFDANRRESQRDFADGTGMLARTLVEGLFGVTPDLLAGELRVRPGFPAEWNRASMHHPDFDLAFTREGERELFTVATRFARPVAVRLQVPALRDDIAALTVNGQAARWRVIEDAVGTPRIEIETPPATAHTVVIAWRGRVPAGPPLETAVAAGAVVAMDAAAPITELADPQGVLRDARVSGNLSRGLATGAAGHRTVFARVQQGSLRWWQPLALEVRPAAPPVSPVFTTDWQARVGGETKLDLVPLASLFNDRVSQIFSHEYLTPRSPFVSLAQPKQGFGAWCKPTAMFAVDDSGLRAVAAQNGGRLVLPNAVPLVTPGESAAPNIAFVSQWDNFPRELSAPLSGRATKIYLLMAGSTWAMQSRIDNGEVIVTYTDGTTTRLALENPTTWWPIDQDYFIDDFAFARPGPLPLRVDLKTGKVRVLEAESFKGRGRTVPGGAATVLDLTVDPAKELKSLTVRALANEVVIGLMSATLQRP